MFRENFDDSDGFDWVKAAEDASVLEVKEQKAFHNLVEEARVLDLPEDIYGVAVGLMNFLKKKHFNYVEDGTTLQDIFSKKGGNCLGLTLILGILLRVRGFRPDFQIMLNIKDAAYDESKEILDEWMSGHGEIKQDTPLPIRKQEASHRFIPTSHPVLFYGGGALRGEFRKHEFEQILRRPQ